MRRRLRSCSSSCRRRAAERAAALGEAHALCTFSSVPNARSKSSTSRCAAQRATATSRRRPPARGGSCRRRRRRARRGRSGRGCARAARRAAAGAPARSRRSRRPSRASGASSPKLGRALAVVARHLRDERDLARVEARQPGVEDQVARVLVVVVVVDGHADVVQHRRGPQSSSRSPAVAGVQAASASSSNIPSASVGDVLGVRGARPWYCGGEVQDARAPHVVEQRRVAGEVAARRRRPRAGPPR